MTTEIVTRSGQRQCWHKPSYISTGVERGRALDIARPAGEVAEIGRLANVAESTTIAEIGRRNGGGPLARSLRAGQSPRSPRQAGEIAEAKKTDCPRKRRRARRQKKAGGNKKFVFDYHRSPEIHPFSSRGHFTTLAPRKFTFFLLVVC